MITKIKIEKKRDFDEAMPISLNLHERIVICNALMVALPEWFKQCDRTLIKGVSASLSSAAISQLLNKLTVDNASYWDDLPQEVVESPELSDKDYKMGLVTCTIAHITMEEAVKYAGTGETV